MRNKTITLSTINRWVTWSPKRSFVYGIGSEGAPQPPSAHRTVRTGPYTAPHARRIHKEISNQCTSLRSDRISGSNSLINQRLG